MAEKVSDKEVRHVANLARLTLGADELARMQRDLSSILGYVEKLGELDTSDVPPTAHAVELPTTLRPDEPRAGLPVEKALGNAPERLGDGFGVPKIIE
jgi:aspartyl-tRNA(Asn)/glutamyl-tRNA(Gln) amidotransferase subunit C